MGRLAVTVTVMGLVAQRHGHSVVMVAPNPGQDVWVTGMTG